MARQQCFQHTDPDLRMLNVPTYCGISLLVITGNTIRTVLNDALFKEGFFFPRICQCGKQLCIAVFSLNDNYNVLQNYPGYKLPCESLLVLMGGVG